MHGDTVSRPTLADVAARAGVSASTASLAFSGTGPVSDATRERVLAAARELNYGGPDPRARSLRRGRSGIVGVVIDDRVSEAFRDPVNIAMLDGVAEAIGEIEAGLLLLTGVSGADTPVSLETAPLDAVVLFGCSPRLEEAVAMLARRGIPAVVIEGDAGQDVPEVALDNREATRLGAQHLRDLGHERVAIVTLPLDPSRARGALTPARAAASTVSTATERLLGARDVYPDAPGVVAAGSYVDEGIIAGRALLADPASRPTAVIAQSDLLAAGVIRAAEELGLRVPDDVSVVGFDGITVEGLDYDLTTLSQPSQAKGKAAGDAVVRMLAGEHPESVTFTSTFHRGDTTGPPPAAR
ncbi:LacI family DNA-binding transcriptional regulator [Rathayibacter sp. YIM 133350]|uniref:LacI family DNA-binding transcriptional regulator n=1 Tax=Rathayibacter sp. YIM 133350 TaxID=3131992 RepID=UPI00307F8DEF